MAEPSAPSSLALYSVAKLRALERAAQQKQTPSETTLMQRAGHAAAELALSLIGLRNTGTEDGATAANTPPASTAAMPAAVLILAGPGNNGGDGLAMVPHLCANGVAVTIVLLAREQDLPADARQALAAAQAGTADFADPRQAPELLRRRWDLIVDALFGIGLRRPLEGQALLLARLLNARSDSGISLRNDRAAPPPCPVLALDIPSGLHADSGVVLGGSGKKADGGEAGIAIVASHTISFLGNKPGLHTAQGRDFAGQVVVAGLSIAPALYPAATATLLTPECFEDARKPRKQASHKGSYGDVMVAGGGHGMAGAVILAARAAAFCGAGKVFAGFLDQPPAFDPGHPELMCRAAASLEPGQACLVVGTGMGQSPAAARLLKKLLGTPGPLVLDADALNLIAARPALATMLASRATPALLTPHPLEAARLLGVKAGEVQADRLGAAFTLAKRFHAVVILKGSGSVIAFPDGTLFINTTGNAGLATAGSGDVLSGICGALLAQAWPMEQAALGAAWLHGKAADVLVARGSGPTGLTAGELIEVTRMLLNQKDLQALSTP